MGFAELHQHSQQWNTQSGTDESRRDLQRTKTMPARRARSSTDVADGSDNEQHRRRRHSPGPGVVDDGGGLTRRGSKNQKELLNPSSLGDPDDVEDAEQDDDDARSSCRVYRVRSFTTKKGGSVVNRGDSIKICGSGGRRGSQLVITPTNETDLLGGGLQTPSQSSSLRRRSVTCLTSGSGSRLQPEVVGVGVSNSRRHSFIIRQPTGGDGGGGGLGRRTSLRGNDRRTTAPLDRAVAYRVELTLGQNNLRRTSADRLSDGDATDLPSAGTSVNGVDDPRNLPDNVEADDDDEVDDDENDADVQVYKVMVLGSHGVGKTTLVQQLLTSEYLANADDDRG